MEDDKKEIVNFALEQLKKAVSDLKSGKTPTISRDLKKITQILNEANNKLKENKITEENMESVVKDIAKKVKKEDK
jgi:hypothetical protein